MVKCPRCDKTVYSNEAVKVAGGDWHSGCVRCRECGCSLNVKTAMAHTGDVYCKVHVPKPKATTVADSVMMEHAKQAQNTKSHAKEGTVKNDDTKPVHASASVAPPKAASSYGSSDAGEEYGGGSSDNYGGGSEEYGGSSDNNYGGGESNEYGSNDYGSNDYQEESYE